MARYHDIDASIWEELEDNSPSEKLLYIYAFSNPLVRDSGLYRIGDKTILSQTGLSRSSFEGALKGLAPKIAYDQEQKVMFVAGKFKRRLSGLKNNKNMIKAVQHDLDAFKDSFVTALFINKYEGALKGLGSLSLPLPLPLPIINEDKKHDLPTSRMLCFGEHGLVRMTAEEHEKLSQKLGGSVQTYVSRLEKYIGQTGKKYKSHYFTILNWYGKDNEPTVTTNSKLSRFVV